MIPADVWVDLAIAERILHSLGWATHPIGRSGDGSAELPFYRPDDPERQGLIDSTGHLAVDFSDDWELIDALRALFRAPRQSSSITYGDRFR